MFVHTLYMDLRVNSVTLLCIFFYNNPHFCRLKYLLCIKTMYTLFSINVRYSINLYIWYDCKYYNFKCIFYLLLSHISKIMNSQHTIIDNIEICCCDNIVLFFYKDLLFRLGRFFIKNYHSVWCQARSLSYKLLSMSARLIVFKLYTCTMYM